MRFHPLRGACSQLHFSGTSRIFREPDTETDKNKSRQRPGNRHTDTRETQACPHRTSQAGFGGGLGGKDLKIHPRPLWLWFLRAGLHGSSLDPDKDVLPTRGPIQTPKSMAG